MTKQRFNLFLKGIFTLFIVPAVLISCSTASKTADPVDAFKGDASVLANVDIPSSLSTRIESQMQNILADTAYIAHLYVINTQGEKVDTEKVTAITDDKAEFKNISDKYIYKIEIEVKDSTESAPVISVVTVASTTPQAVTINDVSTIETALFIENQKEAATTDTESVAIDVKSFKTSIAVVKKVVESYDSDQKKDLFDRVKEGSATSKAAIKSISRETFKAVKTIIALPTTTSKNIKEIDVSDFVKVKDLVDLIPEVEAPVSEVVSDEKIQELHTNAMKFVDQGKLKDAVKIYKEILSARPKDTTANVITGIEKLHKIANNTTLQEVIKKVEKELNVEAQPVSSVAGASSFQPVDAGTLTKLATSLGQPTTLNKLLKDSIDAIETNLLPDFDTAITHFERVLAQPTFSIKINVDLTGISETKEFDKGDLYAITATLRLTNAILHGLVAYDLHYDDSVNYTSVSEFLEKNKSFGTLRPTGKDHIRKVGKSFEKMLSHIVNGVESIRKETDDQSDDIIVSYMISSDVDKTFPEVKKVIASLQREAQTLTIINPKDSTDIKSLRVNLGSFFNNPITDIRLYTGVNIMGGMTKESFPAHFDFTLNSLFPDLKSYDDWQKFNFFNMTFYQPFNSYNFYQNDDSNFQAGTLYKVNNTLVNVREYDSLFDSGYQTKLTFFDTQSGVSKVGEYELEASYIGDVMFSGTNALVDYLSKSKWTSMIDIIDFSDPSTPKKLKTLENVSSGRVALDNNIVYVYSRDSKNLRIVHRYSVVNGTVEEIASGNLGTASGTTHIHNEKLVVSNGTIYLIEKTYNSTQITVRELPVSNLTDAVDTKIMTESTIASSISQLTGLDIQGDKFIFKGLNFDRSSAMVGIVTKTGIGSYSSMVTRSTWGPHLNATTEKSKVYTVVEDSIKIYDSIEDFSKEHGASSVTSIITTHLEGKVRLTKFNEWERNLNGIITDDSHVYVSIGKSVIQVKK